VTIAYLALLHLRMMSAKKNVSAGLDIVNSELIMLLVEQIPKVCNETIYLHEEHHEA
jgi:hypothetical protein